MKHYGDITKIHGWDAEPVDVITGGSPCQDLSVAGKRAGLDGERSGLFMEQIRIIKEMRERDVRTGRTNEFIRPRWMVWENVPGAFSSNGGEDFRIVLEETARIVDQTATIPRPKDGKWSNSGCIMGNGWSIAWRVHDAQFWGVPQRRRRIALVADFGGESAPEILFERKGVSRNPSESGEERKRTTGDFEDCVGKASQGISAGFDGNMGAKAGNIGYEEEKSPTLNAGKQMCAFTFFNGASESLREPGAYTLKIRSGAEKDRYGKKAGKGPLVQTELSATLGVSQDQTLITNVIGFNRERRRAVTTNDAMPTLQAASGESGNNHPTVCQNDQGGQQIGCDVYNQKLCGDVSPTITSAVGGSNTSGCKVLQCIPIEGNGSRESHRGNGYGDNGDPEFTLNSVEQHAVCYGFPLGFRPENVRVYCEKATSLCNGTRPGFTCGVIGSNANQDTICYGISAYESNAMKSSNPHSGIYETETARTLDLNGGSPACNQGGVAIVNGAERSDVCVNYKADGADGNGVAFATVGDHENRPTDMTNLVLNSPATYQTVTGCLDCGITKGTGNQLANQDMFVANTSMVRRLTPTECERLQGFPDGWTDIGEWIDSKGKKHKEADSPRYKALGNSIALPFWEWMAKRMAQYIESEEPTMASLFDGIGGFPLAFSRAGIKPVWASEIEEFPIAVTKLHFPEEGGKDGTI